jgi:hypothetical protein
MYPPPEIWSELVKNDETLTLFDMNKGPQELTSIKLITLGEYPDVPVDAISRNILHAITVGAKTYHEQTLHSNTVDDPPSDR